ncbi:MAG TPA: DUF3341 domain-containing protein [Polyangiaceae bacterium]|jgi:hypothetical protein
MLSGVVAEFETPEALEGAYEALTRQGYTRLDAWTPYPVRSLVKAGFDGSIVAWIMLVAGLAGGALGYLIQLWVNVRAFRINVGGRPLDSAPAFIPITFESAVLLSAVTGFIAMLALSRLPRLHHPLFEIEGFERASVDRFWLGVDEADPMFDARVSEALTRLGALRCARLGGGP